MATTTAATATAMRPSVLLGLRLPSAGGGWLYRPARHRTRDDVRRPRSPPCDCGAATELRLRMMSAGAESQTGEVQILADCSCPALPALSVRPATCCRPPSMHMRSDSPPASLPLPAKHYAPAATSGRPVPATPGSAPPGKRVATPKHGGTQTQGSGGADAATPTPRRLREGRGTRRPAAQCSLAALAFLPLVARASSSRSAPTLSERQEGHPPHPPRRAQLAFKVGSPARASGEAADRAPTGARGERAIAQTLRRLALPSRPTRPRHVRGQSNDHICLDGHATLAPLLLRRCWRAPSAAASRRRSPNMPTTRLSIDG